LQALSVATINALFKLPVLPPNILITTAPFKLIIAAAGPAILFMDVQPSGGRAGMLITLSRPVTHE